MSTRERWIVSNDLDEQRKHLQLKDKNELVEMLLDPHYSETYDQTPIKHTHSADNDSKIDQVSQQELINLHVTATHQIQRKNTLQQKKCLDLEALVRPSFEQIKKLRHSLTNYKNGNLKHEFDRLKEQNDRLKAEIDRLKEERNQMKSECKHGTPYDRIDDGLKVYYQRNNIKDYKNNNGIGRFKQFVMENGFECFDENDVEYDLNNAKDCPYLEFDPYFPLTDEFKNADKSIKETEIFNIIRHCYKYGLPPNNDNKYKKQIIKLKNEINSMNQYQRKMKETIDELRKEKYLYQQESNLKGNKIRELGEEMEQNAQQIIALKNKINSMHNMDESKDRILVALGEEMEQYEQAIDRLKNEINSMNEYQRRMNETTGKRIGELRKERDLYQQESNFKGNIIRELGEEMEQDAQQIIALENMHESKDRILVALGEEIDEYEQEIDQLRQQLGRYQHNQPASN